MIFERIVKLLENRLHVQASLVEPASTLAGDLGLDSLDLTELWLALENEFGKRIPIEIFRKFKTVAHISAYIYSL